MLNKYWQSWQVCYIHSNWCVQCILPILRPEKKYVYMGPPLKIKISKIRLRYVLSWPKVGLEPKSHDPGTFGDFGKREQTYKQTDKIHVL